MSETSWDFSVKFFVGVLLPIIGKQKWSSPSDKAILTNAFLSEQQNTLLKTLLQWHEPLVFSLNILRWAAWASGQDWNSRLAVLLRHHGTWSLLYSTQDRWLKAEKQKPSFKRCFEGWGGGTVVGHHLVLKPLDGVFSSLCSLRLHQWVTQKSLLTIEIILRYSWKAGTAARGFWGIFVLTAGCMNDFLIIRWAVCLGFAYFASVS